MKKMNKKLTTLMLAGALCAATLSGVAAAKPVVSLADEEPAAVKYALTEVFATNKATLDAEKATDGDAEASLTALTLSDEGKVTLKRDLAFTWYEGKNDVKYLTVKFAFKDLKFKSVSFTVESESAWATEDGKATNVVTFTCVDEKVSVAVNDGEAVETAIIAGQDVTLALGAGAEDGEYAVMLAVGEGEAKNVGKFVNVGSSYAEYTAGKMLPLVISADVTDDEKSDAKAVVYLKEINNQKFDNVTTKSETDKALVVTDTAAPVLVVNESVSGFLLGTAFSLEYEKIDVLQGSNYTDTKEYYQYNPTDKEIKYNTLTTSVYFMDTVYTENGKTTSVYNENGKEYVSVKITVGDKFGKKEYDLSWYANAGAVETVDEKDYIIIDRNEQGATYNHIKADDATKKNVVSDSLENERKAYQKRLDEAALDVYAGSNSYIYFPSVKWLLNDNNGYRNLKFTISYKRPSSDSAQSSSSLSYNGLKLSVADEGLYEFKIFAVDKAGNTMKYYLNEELVDVSTSNVWDIEEIPSFTFEIKNLGLKVNNETSTKASDRMDEEDIGEKYTLSDIKVVGASSLKENYALYIINSEKADKIGLSKSVLSGITYQALRNKMSAGLKNVQDKKYIEYYLDCYADLLAEKLGKNVSKQQVKDCFRLIEEYDDRITEENDKAEWNKNNKYNWSVSSQSFTATDAGIYVIMADYWEAELPVQRAAAYQLVVVESEVDSIEGATLSWIKNNVVSVVLFGIAGLLLIAIIVLLLIKPSDETMEDVDVKAAKKAEKAAKKEKKSKDEQ